MKRIMLIIAAMSLSTLINAATAQLVVAVQDSGASFGTDAATTSQPNAGMNNMPTKNVGNESNAVNQDAPQAKPGEAPAFAPPPAFAPAPAYTPPANQSGTTNTQP